MMRLVFGWVALSATTAVDGQWIEQRLKSFGIPGQSAANPASTLILGTDGALYGVSVYGGTEGGGSVFRVNTNGSGYLVLHSFRRSTGEGENPTGRLVQGTDGLLYGTTRNSGNNSYVGYGTVFKVETNGSGYAVLHNFTSSFGDGQYPAGGLVQGLDGALYGTTPYGGSNGNGTIFKIGTSGTSYTVLYSFDSNRDGGNPVAGLTQASDGSLYGVTQYGGGGYGTVFRIGPDGSGYSVLYAFSGSGGDGQNPIAELALGSDGCLYGTAPSGGSNGGGVIYKVSTNGSHSVLYNFNGPGGDGFQPKSGLVQGSDGTLYGTTYLGPIVNGTGYETNGAGAIFEISTNGTGYTLLYTFSNSGGDGQHPQAGLVQGSDGGLYGTTYSGGSSGVGTLFKLDVSSAGYSVLYNFSSTGGDAWVPLASLVQGRDGALYGTTLRGGAFGFGTVFKTSTDGGLYAILHSFSTNGDGYSPYGRLVQGKDGLLYGTASSGGNGAVGTIFRLSTNGNGYALLHSFTTNGDGYYPGGGLLQGADGALYGTTDRGGTNGSGGTVFRMSPDGSSYALLHSFTNNDGFYPGSDLVQGVDGVLYGVTGAGGASDAGTVFKVWTNGAGFSVLHNFSNPSYASGALLQGNDGALYGATYDGGSNYFGAVFRLAIDGTGYSLLHSFGETASDAQYPNGGLVQGKDGLLYGTTEYCETGCDEGRIFAVSTNGAFYAQLYAFTGVDGAEPRCGLVQGSDGAFYGTTESGGDMGLGTVFRLVPSSSAPAFAKLTRSGGVTLLTLNATPGRSYQLQYKTGLSQPSWSNIGSAVVAGSSALTVSDSTTDSRRFYRAVLLP